jgi:ABC-2 type transport system ATP-binding protein
MLCLRHYKKAYGAVTILAAEQLDLAAGVYWLKGENGAGKTTLLKSIAGLIPFEGNITWDHLNIRKQRLNYTRLVSFAGAEPVFPLFLTGNELLAFYRQVRGGSEEQVKELADSLGAAPFLSQKISTYSSGMLKKLSLVLCFTGHPTLVLLDEPFITLDVNAVNELRQLITRYYHQGISFLISSHQDLALDLPAQCLQVAQQTIKAQAYVDGTH